MRLAASRTRHTLAGVFLTMAFSLLTSGRSHAQPVTGVVLTPTVLFNVTTVITGTRAAQETAASQAQSNPFLGNDPSGVTTGSGTSRVQYIGNALFIVDEEQWKKALTGTVIWDDSGEDSSAETSPPGH